MKLKTKSLIIIIFLIILVIISTASIFFGRYAIDFQSSISLFADIIRGVDISQDDIKSNLHMIIFDIRMPRIFAAVLIGAALSVSGAMMQSVFVNPLVSPGIMGVLSGASFGAAFGIVTFSSWVYVQFSSFIFGMISLFLALLIARVYKSTTALMLVLGGMISGAFFSALLSIVKITADPYNELASIVFWLMGSLSMADSGAALIKAGIPLLIVTIGSCFLGRVLNILSMGDDEAKALGINSNRYRVIILVVSAFLASMTVVIAGNIGWVGLIIPHIARMIIGPDNRFLLPLSAILGAIFLLICDNIVRNISSAELPLGIITSIIGLIVFTIVLRNSQKGWHS